MLSYLYCHCQLDEFPLHDYTLRRAQGETGFPLTTPMQFFLFLYCFLFSSTPAMLSVVFGTPANTTQFPHYRESSCADDHKDVCVTWELPLETHSTQAGRCLRVA